MWEVWTNGLYKSTLHRVVHRGSNYRVSYVQSWSSHFCLSTGSNDVHRIPFFFEANFDAVVEPLPAARRIQDEDRAIAEPLKVYEPVVYGDFLLKKLSGNYATSHGKGRYDAE